MFLSEELEKVTKNRVITGVGDGEKIILANEFDRLIFLCSSFVLAGKIKRGLEGLGKRVEIVSNARENDDENDKNLLPFVEAVNNYLAGNLDALIFLPCSMIIKFDLAKFNSIKINKNQNYSLEELTKKLVEYGYERTSLVSEKGQFALRGDILDIFSSNDKPYRVEFFDDLVENISVFDPNTMKNIEKLESVSITLSKLPLGNDNVTSLEGKVILDEPKKVDEEISLLVQSYSSTSFYNHNNYENFDSLFAKSDVIFDNFQVLKADYYNDKLAGRSYLTDFLALKQD